VDRPSRTISSIRTPVVPIKMLVHVLLFEVESRRYLSRTQRHTGIRACGAGPTAPHQNAPACPSFFVSEELVRLSNVAR